MFGKKDKPHTECKMEFDDPDFWSISGRRMSRRCDLFLWREIFGSVEDHASLKSFTDSSNSLSTGSERSDALRIDMSGVDEGLWRGPETILDVATSNPGTPGIIVEEDSVEENDGNIELTVERTGSTVGTVSVNYLILRCRNLHLSCLVVFLFLALALFDLTYFVISV